MTNNNLSAGFGWDDEVDESSFELVPDGDYRFTVKEFERGWYEGSAKIAPCNEAQLKFEITWVNAEGKQHTNLINYKLKLTRNLQFLIYQFFESIGLRKKGDGTTRMPWNDIIGKVGICEVGHREGTNGNTYNEIRKCYPPELAPTVVANEPKAEDLNLKL